MKYWWKVLVLEGVPDGVRLVAYPGGAPENRRITQSAGTPEHALISTRPCAFLIHLHTMYTRLKILLLRTTAVPRKGRDPTLDGKKKQYFTEVNIYPQNLKNEKKRVHVSQQGDNCYHAYRYPHTNPTVGE